MGIAANLFFSTSDLENCLDWRIRPSDEQYEAQKERWNDLRDFLLADLAQSADCPMASWLQGSYKFGTQIRPAQKGQEFDIDLGVYFQWSGNPDDGPHAPVELKAFVQTSLASYCELEDNDAEAVDEPRARCSRVHFTEEFHIDVPAYHLDAKRDVRALATADDAWEISDPKAIYRWWKDSFTDLERARCRRIVRYLKMWGALKFKDEERPSSILLTVLAARAYLRLDRRKLTGDDEVFAAVVASMIDQLNKTFVVKNPANGQENLNRLSEVHCRTFVDRLADLHSIAERGLLAQTKLLASDIWSEAFEHFFPVPSDEEIREEALIKANDGGRAIARITFDPIVNVQASSKTRTFSDVNKIGPIPKGCEITFGLGNAHLLPDGATVTWTVRNAGAEAENENDLGHLAGEGTSVKRDSAYRGAHVMDVRVKLNGSLIGSRRIPVTVTGLGMPLRNPPRPSWTKLRAK
ncbi:MAG: hypothetical protein K2Y42_20375 [Hyphomicrobium sp.]|jgi:hypothetical protein|uniref:CBASS cGAMP synthase n=1 Tax=Hyphomicrobium sp. TaxID=82 RepID=UPI0025C413C4|nr:CBASS cGAMP synthase [Hyphomicrobium sp.]MBX9865105.1 hypothetical protein [Hyphomicrobium sp.]